MKKFILEKTIIFLILALVLSLSACVGNEKKEEIKSKDVYYEIFVGSFNDSDGDKTGDLKGVTKRLSYLEDLGVGGIWLMPIMPSDTYHKYDVDDYCSIDPKYGSMEDFEELISEAKKKNIDIIIDLPLNHTSDTHPWFVEAKQDFLNDNITDTSKYHYYNFSKEALPGYARIDDTHYYEAVFWEGMPDLNLDNPALREHIKEIVEFWLNKGVKGFRLDAVLHFYESNVTKNNEFIKWLQGVIKEKKSDAFVVGEVWASDSTILEHYKGGIDSMFHFGLSGADGNIVATVRKGKGAALAEKIVSFHNEMRTINPDALSSVFLSNHDQSRSAGFFKDPELQKLCAALYLMSPDVPFVYYGEEIGIKGSGKDENKRTAMLWGEGNDCNDPVGVDYKSQIDSSVKAQIKDKTSLLNYYRAVTALRNKYISHDMEVSAYPVNEHIFALKYDDTIVMINTDKQPQTVDFNGEILEQLNIVADKSSYDNGRLNIAPYGLIVGK